MDLTTNYLGLKLAHPIVCGACPLGTNVESISKVAEAGASAIVLPSLFEEEIMAAVRTAMEMEADSGRSAEASSYLPNPDGYHVGPDQYLDHVGKAKAATSIPIIGSLNGTTPGGWTNYAKKIQDAGADALELNLYELATDPDETGQQVEDRLLNVVKSVKESISIPIAVKLSTFLSSPANIAKKLADAGADGIVLFNRFYQPDIDTEELEVVPDLKLSTTDELRLRLRWLAILSGKVNASLSATGGAHQPIDVIKAVMAGADTVQLVSALLINGPEHITRTVDGVRAWMQEHEYESVEQMKGSMSLAKATNPKELVRANYMKMLDSWEK